MHLPRQPGGLPLRQTQRSPEGPRFRWREDPGLLSRPCRERRPSAREDGGVSGLCSSCGARGGFLPRFGLRPQGPCRVGTGESGLVLSEEGNSACLSSRSVGLRPLVELCVEPAGVSRRCTGVSLPLHLVPSPTGLPSKRCPGAGADLKGRCPRGLPLSLLKLMFSRTGGSGEI